LRKEKNGQLPVFFVLLNANGRRMKTKRLHKRHGQKKVGTLAKGRELKNRPPVNEKDIARQVEMLAEPLCEAEGIELVHVEYQRESGGRVLRLYMDKPGGIILDDCARISRQLNDLLDVSLENVGPYRLEVSSPGSDRPLGKLADFERFRGNMAKIRVSGHEADSSEKPPKSKTFQGLLMGVTEGLVNLLPAGADNDQVIRIPFQEIIRARLVNHRKDSDK
jgi:ribosome maturation factor RimP